MYRKPRVLIALAVQILSFLAIQTEARVNTGGERSRQEWRCRVVAGAGGHRFPKPVLRTWRRDPRTPRDVHVPGGGHGWLQPKI